MIPNFTISMPCYGRPERTKRSLQCLTSQDIVIGQIELILIGDHCPHFQKLIESQWFKDWLKLAKAKNLKVVYYNKVINHGYHGYACTNMAIKAATGKYFTFFANDDTLPKNYFNWIVQLISYGVYKYKFIGVPVNIVPQDKYIWPEFRKGHFGHGHLIVKTDLLKKMPPHSKRYTHDWELIKNLRAATDDYFLFKPGEGPYTIPNVFGWKGGVPIYQVRSIPTIPEIGID